MKLRQLTISIIIFNILVSSSIFIIIPGTIGAETLTEYGNPDSKDERTITFSGTDKPLIDASTYLEFPLHKGTVRSARMKLTASDLDNEYPLKPSLDVGVDGDVDWEYNGTGYGPLGGQNVFNTDEAAVNVYTESSPNQNYGVILPMDAAVTSSTMELKGGAEKPLSGRNPSSGTTQSTLYANYTHYEKFISYLNIYCYISSPSRGTVTVNGWNPNTTAWEQIDYRTGWVFPLTVIYDPVTPQYTKWEITLVPNYSWTNVYYSYTYEVLMGCLNATLDIGSDGGAKEWSYPYEFNTTDNIDMTAKLNQLMQTTPTPSGVDSYGVEYVHIPFIFETEGPGALYLWNLSVQYDFMMVVEAKPDLENLTTELNELIPPEGNGTYRIYLEFSSQTPGKLKIWDLDIVYNDAPTATFIDGCELDEDTSNLKLKDLSQYFTDDFDNPKNLMYIVEEYTNSKHLKINTNMHYLSVNATKTPNTNWHGESEVLVSAADSEGVKTYANKFTVIINSVDDPPTVGAMLPNITVIGYQSNIDIDLDDPSKSFFEDVDSSELYFGAALLDTQYQSWLNITINEENVLILTKEHSPFQISYRYAEDIPLRIYCDDEPISEDANLSLLKVYQDILVDLVSKDGKYGPLWEEIPDVYIPEDSVLEDWITLTDYASDYDDIKANLTFSIVSYSNSGYIDVNIDSNNQIDIYPEANFDKTSMVWVKVEDMDGFSHTISFYIYMIPKNDDPTVSIISPRADSTVAGIIKINGTAYDIEANLVKIELRFGKSSDEWHTVEGLSYWQYDWDTFEYAPDTAKKLEVAARAFDGENYSEHFTLEVIIDNQKFDADGDGSPDTDDKFPNDPSEWKDTDGDGVGDNGDVFPRDRKEWEDTDGDGYGDNEDVFPLDPSQWADKDGDGYGDNPDGNNGDLDPDDPNVNIEKTKKDEAELDPVILDYLWFVAAAMVIVNVLIILFYFKSQSKNKK